MRREEFPVGKNPGLKERTRVPSRPNRQIKPKSLKAISDASEQYRVLAEHAMDITWIRDMNLRLTYVSPSVARTTGYTVEETMALTLERVFTPESLEAARHALEEEMVEEMKGPVDPSRVRILEMEGFRKDGTRIWTEEKMTFLRDPGGKPIAILGVSREITDRKKTEEALKESEERYRNLFEESRDAIVITDGGGYFLELNGAALDLFGYSKEEIMDKNFGQLYVDPTAGAMFQREMHEKGSVRGYEAKLLARDKREMDCLLTVTAKRASDGGILRYQGIIRDITEQRRMHEALRQSERRYKELSITDELTGLYNVRHFYAQLKSEADRASRYHRPLSMLMIDLDDFKNYNDSYGHLEGDKVLAGLGAMIRDNTRRTDSGYRYGGEEFTVILPETPAKYALIIAERLRMKSKNQVLSPVQAEKVQITVSIGISEYVPGEEISEFIKRADRRMYLAKEQGKDQICSQ
jgi:diguanylate cyclase (GGDEF)-like protein/PAS domain S-box-containing protein